MSPIVIAFIIAIIWGVPPIIHRWLTTKKGVPVYIIILVSAIVYFIAALLYICCVQSATGMQKDLVKHREWLPLLALVTLVGLFVANQLYLHMVKSAANINLVITISALYPIVTMIFAIVFLQEHPTPIAFFGFLLVMVGITLMLMFQKS